MCRRDPATSTAPLFGHFLANRSLGKGKNQESNKAEARRQAELFAQWPYRAIADYMGWRERNG